MVEKIIEESEGVQSFCRKYERVRFSDIDSLLINQRETSVSCQEYELSCWKREEGSAKKS